VDCSKGSSPAHDRALHCADTALCADSYSGEYKNGRRSGVGKYTFASGTVYEGDYVNNAKVSLPCARIAALSHC